MAKVIAVRIGNSKPRTHASGTDGAVILDGTVYNGPASVVGRGVVVPMGFTEACRVGLSILMALPAGGWSDEQIDSVRKLHAIISVKG